MSNHESPGTPKNIQSHDQNVNGQRHAKRDLQTYAKTVDPNQPLPL